MDSFLAGGDKVQAAQDEFCAHFQRNVQNADESTDRLASNLSMDKLLVGVAGGGRWWQMW